MSSCILELEFTARNLQLVVTELHNISKYNNKKIKIYLHKRKYTEQRRFSQFALYRQIKTVYDIDVEEHVSNHEHVHGEKYCMSMRRGAPC